MDPQFSISRPEYGADETWYVDVHGPNQALLRAKRLVFKGCNASDFQFLLFHPVAERIEFHNCNWDICGVGEPPEFNDANVRETVFTQTTIDGADLEELLRILPRLRRIRYERLSGSEDAKFGECGLALCKYGQNIESLSWLNPGLSPFMSYIKTLAPMESLKILEIDLETLVGCRDLPRGDWPEYMNSYRTNDGNEPDYEEINAGFGDWSFINKLPPSLEVLIIEIESPKLWTYFNTYERYGAKFEELISASRRFRNLTYINAPNMDRVAARTRDRLPHWVLGRCHELKRIAPPPAVVEDYGSMDYEDELDTHPECLFGKNFYHTNPWETL